MCMKTKNKKFLIISLLAGALLALTLFVSEKTGTINLFNADRADETNQSEEIGYSPPTKEEREAGDSKKQQIVDQSEENPVSGAVDVVIVDADQYGNEIEVRAFVANLVENGTCTIRFSKDATYFDKEVPAYSDASTTPCVTLTVPRQEFASAGTWDVTITYKGSQKMGSTQGTINIE